MQSCCCLGVKFLGYESYLPTKDDFVYLSTRVFNNIKSCSCFTQPETVFSVNSVILKKLGSQGNCVTASALEKKSQKEERENYSKR